MIFLGRGARVKYQLEILFFTVKDEWTQDFLKPSYNNNDNKSDYDLLNTYSVPVTQLSILHVMILLGI